MKKILSQIMLISMTYAINEQTAIGSDLMKEAFPTPGFTKCYSDRGKINWAAVKRIEDSQGKAGINAVSTYVINNIQPCMTSANPNFTGKVQNSCKTNFNTKNQAWLCQAAGTPVQGAQAQTNTAVLSISSNQANKLLENAVPKSSNPIDSCPASSGRVNWAITKQLTQNGFTTLVQNRLMQVVLPCILEKNKNMVDELENTCRTPVDLKEQNVICERIATLRKRSNAVVIAAQQQATAAAAAIESEPIVGVELTKDMPTSTVTGTIVSENPAVIDESHCPNLDSKEAELAAKEAELTAERAALTEEQEKLDDYKKILKDFHGQLTELRNQLVEYQEKIKSQIH